MAKRFTDTGKWQDEWFDNLTNEEKLFWLYLCDSCNHAGIWKVNKKLAEYHIGKIDWESIDKKFEDRVIKINDEKWFVSKFVEFQYPHGLSKKLKIHQSVIDILNQYKLNRYIYLMSKRGLKKTSIRPQLEVKDKDKEKDKDFKDFKYINKDFKDLKEKKVYGEHKLVMLTDEEYQKLINKFGEEGTKQRITNLELYIGSKGVKYKSHYLTILHWEVKNNVGKTERGRNTESTKPSKYDKLTVEEV